MINENDRLGFTLSIAFIIHAIFILGVGFDFEEARHKKNNIHIILVQENTKKTSKKYDALAQADLEGGGEAQESKIPSVPNTVVFPDTLPKEVQSIKDLHAASDITRTQRNNPLTEKPQSKELLTHKTLNAKIQNHTGVKETLHEKVTRNTSNRQMQTNHTQQGKHKLSHPGNSQSVETPADSPEVASLKAAIALKLEAIAKRPRRTFISASTKKSIYAAYMEEWRVMVEKIGNINYPHDVNEQQLSGAVLMDVAIGKDGTVKAIRIIKSSGEKKLDNAATQIARMASPFKPFSNAMRKETDILHITRTWEFSNGKNRIY